MVQKGKAQDPRLPRTPSPKADTALLMLLKPFRTLRGERGPGSPCALIKRTGRGKYRPWQHNVLSFFSLPVSSPHALGLRRVSLAFPGSDPPSVKEQGSLTPLVSQVASQSLHSAANPKGWLEMGVPVHAHQARCPMILSCLSETSLLSFLQFLN